MITQEEYQKLERDFLVQVLDRAAADDDFRQKIKSDPSLAFEDPQLEEACKAYFEPIASIADLYGEVDERELELSSKLLDLAMSDEDFRTLLLADPDAAFEKAGLADERRELVAAHSAGGDDDVEAHWTPAYLASVRFCAAVAAYAVKSAQQSCVVCQTAN